MRGYVRLTYAACRLEMSYGRVLRLVLIGDLIGRQEEGHWWVLLSDLVRLEAVLETLRIHGLPLLASARDIDTDEES